MKKSFEIKGDATLQAQKGVTVLSQVIDGPLHHRAMRYRAIATLCITIGSILLRVSIVAWILWILSTLLVPLFAFVDTALESAAAVLDSLAANAPSELATVGQSLLDILNTASASRALLLETLLTTNAVFREQVIESLANIGTPSSAFEAIRAISIRAAIILCVIGALLRTGGAICKTVGSDLRDRSFAKVE